MSYAGMGAVMTEDVLAAKQAGTYAPTPVAPAPVPSVSVAVPMPTPGAINPTSSVPDWLQRIVQYQQGTLPPPPPPVVNGGGSVASKPIIMPPIYPELPIPDAGGGGTVDTKPGFPPPPPPPPTVLDQGSGPGPVTQNELSKSRTQLEAATYARQQAYLDALNASPISESLISSTSLPLATLDAQVNVDDNAQLATIGQAQVPAPQPKSMPKWALPAALVAAYFLFVRK